MIADRYQSWGRYPKVSQKARKLHWRGDSLPIESLSDSSFLPFGNGRSYGDVCLNDGGTVFDCRGLDRFIGFDSDSGVLRCEAGVIISEVLRLTIPAGWFLPVTPGTQFATIGGAIGNDVHGKNHHRAGTFGRHVRCFELLRSDGNRVVCSPSENEGLYRATIGGLGLTGVITWAEIQLHSVKSPYIDQEIIRYENLGEFFALAHESDRSFEHTVAWVDCLARGEKLGRGLFIRGNYAESTEGAGKVPSRMRHTFPVDPPFALVNGLTLRLFNSLYYRTHLSTRVASRVHYQHFFYPLDRIHAWNRIYGSKGFFQYQCAVPGDQMEDAIREILACVSEAGIGSFLVVLKLFGSMPSPGLLSFPLPGATLALDFPNTGRATLRLLDRLDAVTSAAGGRVNPSKDARMCAEDFQRAYPNWAKLEKFIDPKISSSFWRRVVG